jgi:amino acid adenylation domain-containing protein/non-ribosomal peptide synthase protein (TIGR01720 family)
MDSLNDRIARLSPAERDALMRALRQQGTTAAPAPIPLVDRSQSVHAVSPAQQRMWMFQERGGNAAYNMSSAVRLRGPLDLPALQSALDDLQARHESLRTTFELDGVAVVQRVHPAGGQALTQVDLSPLTAADRAAAVDARCAALSQRVFDLQTGPLFETQLLREDAESHVLLVNMHHIISDGWSMGVLIGELSRLYAAHASGATAALDPLPVQYVDYAHWQQDQMGPDQARRHLAYWRERLADAPPLLDLPGDYPRPATKSFQAATLFFDLDASTADAVAALARRCSATPFMVLLAAFEVLLGVHSGRSDILVATPVANRGRSELAGVIGFFANTVLLRDAIDTALSFTQLLEQVRHGTLQAYAHQELPFDQVVDALNPVRSTAHAPLAQVLFAVQNVPGGDLALGGLAIEPIEIGREGSDFDLVLELQPQTAGYRAILTYSTDLYQAATMRTFGAQYGALLSALVRAPEAPVAGTIAAALPPRLPLPEGAAVDATTVAALQARCADMRLVDADGVHEGRDLLQAAVPAARALAGTAGQGAVVGVAMDDAVAGWTAVLACWHAGVVPLLVDRTLPAGALRALLGRHGCTVLIHDGEEPASPLDADLRAIAWRDLIAPDAAVGPDAIWSPRLDVPALQVDCEGTARVCSHDALHAAVLRQGRCCALVRGDDVTLLRHPGTAGFVRDMLWAGQAARVILHAGGMSGQALLCDDRCIGEVQAAHPGLLPPILIYVGGATDLNRLQAKVGGALVQLHHLHALTPSPAHVVAQSMAGGSASPGQDRWEAWDAALEICDAQGRGCAPTIAGNVRVAGPSPLTLQRRARWRPDGQLQLLPGPADVVRRDGHALALAGIEATVQAHAMVKDAHVALQPTADGDRLVVYVVVARSEAVASVAEATALLLPVGLRPDIWVSVSTIPLCADGRVDLAALKMCPALADTDIARVEQVLSEATAGADTAAVLVDTEVQARRHHLADAIPGWRRQAVEQARVEDAADATVQAATAPQADALLEGNTLPSDLPTDLGAVLRRAAAGDRGVICIDRDGVAVRRSYAQVLVEAEKVLGGLSQAGVVPGDIVVLQLADNLDVVPVFWACVLGGLVPVPLGVLPSYDVPSAGRDKLLNTCRLLQPRAVVASAAQYSGIAALLRREDVPVAVLDGAVLARAQAPGHLHTPDADDVALLLLTSGSTGMPKAVRQSHRALIARSAATALHNGFDAGAVSMNWMPLDHVGGLVMFHVLDTWLACEQLQVATEYVLEAPLRWLDLIQQYRATATWAPNFAFALVNEAVDHAPERSWDLSSMQFILNGGEAIVSKSARGFLRRLRAFGLPGTSMRPSWGMSETCSGVVFSRLTLEGSRDDDPFVAVGEPIPGVAIRIVDADDRVQPMGRVGRLQIRGPNVTSGYLHNVEATSEAFTADGWFNTGDLATIGAVGLTITGREKDVIIINGANFHSHEIEQVVDETGAVQISFTAATAVREPGAATDRLAIFFVPAAEAGDTDAAIRAVRQAVLRGCQVNPSYIVPLSVDDVPKTSIGKIQRGQLAAQLMAGRFDSLLRTQDLLAGNANTVPAWFHRRTWRPAQRRAMGARTPAARIAFVDDALQARALLAASGDTVPLWLVWPAGGAPAVDIVAPDGATPRTHVVRRDRAEDYRALLDAALASTAGVLQLLWFWQDPVDAPAHDPVSETDAALAPVRTLLRVLAQCAPAQDVQFLLARGGEAGATAADAALPGLLRTAALEASCLEPSLVHLADADAEGTVARLLEEGSAAALDHEVMYRRSQRQLPRLSELDVSAADAQPLPLVRGGTYLLTGGLGGIGRYLANRLCHEFDAQVLLIGRSAATPDGDARERERARVLAELRSRARDGAVLYVQADVTDSAAVCAAVAEAERRWGRGLDGVFHLAGDLAEGGNVAAHWSQASCHGLAEETEQAYRAALTPKVGGLHAVVPLLEERPSLLCVAFSSVNALYGGATFGAYSMANGALAGYAEQLRPRFPNTYVIDWAMWDDVGMSQDNPGYAREASRAMGYHAISLEEGWVSMKALLCRSPGRYSVGLDGANRHLLPDIEGTPARRRVLAAYIAAPAALVAQATDTYRDGLGHRHVLDVRPCERIPRLPDGSLDEAALAGMGATGAAEGHDPQLPRNACERTLVEVWRQVLGLQRIGVHENFFELGGDSVLGTQVVARANQAGLRLTSRQLFERQTIAELAEVAAQPDAPAILAEQGVLSGDCPLAPIQAWFFAQPFAHPHHWNQSLLLKVNRPSLDLAAMQAALTALVEHHDALRLCYRQDGGRWHQSYGAPEEVVPEWHDLGMHAPEAAAQAMQDQAAAMQGSLVLERSPALRAACFDLGHGELRLLLVVHHLVTDGVSWRILLEDLATLYTAHAAGTPALLPAKTSAYKAWTGQLQHYARTEQANEQARYWHGMPLAPLPVPLLDGGHNRHGGQEQYELALDEGDTHCLLREAGAAYRTEINDLLLCALALSARALTGQLQLSLTLEGHGREDLFDQIDVSRTVGWFTSMFPLTLDLPAAGDEGRCLLAVKEQLRALPGKGLAYGVVRYLGAGVDEAPAPAVSFNYLGQFDQSMGQGSLFDLALEHPGAMQAHDETRTHAIDVVAFVKDQRLQVVFTYCPTYVRKEDVAAWAAQYVQALRGLVGHCVLASSGGLSPSDVPLLEDGQEELDALVASTGLASARMIETIFPVTPIQHGLIYHSLLAPGEGVYVSHLRNQISGRLDAVAFQQAWQIVAGRHDVYRASVQRAAGAVPVMVVQRSVDLPWVFHDWRSLPPAQQEQRYQALLQEDRERGFCFEQAPLLRVYLLQFADDVHRFVLSEHHAVSDGWSRSIVLAEVLACYQALVAGRRPTLPEPRRFADHVAWLRRQDRTSMAAYWQRTFEGLSPRQPLAGGSLAAPARGEKRPCASRGTLDGRRTAALQALARRCQLTLGVLVQGAWAILLARYSGDADVVYGCTASGRPVDLPGVERTVGPFINSLPVRVQVDDTRELLPWLAGLHAAQSERESHGHCSLADILQWTGLAAGTPLFDTLVVFENYPAVDGVLGDGLRIDWADALDQTELPLTLMVEPGECLSFCLYHDAQRFAPAAATRLLGHLARLLQSMAEQPASALGALPMLTAAEQAAIDGEWNATATDLGDPDATLHGLFAAQLARTPDAVAVIADDRQMTYRQVHQHALAVSRRLSDAGVRPGQHVAVVMEKGWQQVVAVYAVLYAGAAYLPIESSWPAERRAFLVGHGEAAAVLSVPGVACGDVLPAGVARLDIHADDALLEGPVPALQVATDLAYTIFTSGSTGQPKGVMIDHRGAVNTVRDINARFNVEARDRVLAVSSLSFDLSVYDIFGPLAAGAAVVMPAASAQQDPAAWTQLLQAHGVTLWNSVPALLQLLVDELERQDRCLPGSLRLAMLSGDWIPLSLPQRYRARFPGGAIVSMGGATEASIWSILYPIGEVDPSWPSIPYGKALANQRFYVLDARLAPCPIGIEGDLFIGGVGLALGYWRDPVKTAASFIVHPGTGERLYRTGDRGRYLDDGNIEFLGRADFQVKVNGYRIELGEIEATLQQQPGVGDALVVVREDTPGERRLVAYVRPSETGGPVAATLREALAERLPHYMVPWHYVTLAAFPLSANGKVDRKQLPLPDGQAATLPVAPGTLSASEELLLGIWSEVLDRPVVDRDSNFFEMGGHSLLTAQVVVRAREAFSIDLPVRALFESPTVAGLASRIDAQRSAGISRRAPSGPVADDGALSYAQRGLWFLDRLQGQDATYNITTALRLDGVLDEERLRDCLAHLVERHAALRTRFVDDAGVPRRVVDEGMADAMRLIACDAEALEAIAREEAAAPFDLAAGPVHRFTLVRIGPVQHVLLLSVHHIAADGWSMALLLRELAALYAGGTDGARLPPLRLGYADHVARERALQMEGVTGTQLDYWRTRLAGLPALLPIRTDLPRPAVQSFRGATVDLRIGGAVRDRVVAQCNKQGITLYMYLLAALDVVLAHASGSRDIAVGATVANRAERDLEAVFGLFANQVVMRVDLAGDPTFEALLRRARQTALDAYAHQDAPFDQVVDAVGHPRTLAHTPLFQVKLVLQNVPIQQEAMPGMMVEPVGVDAGSSKFDLQFTIEEVEGELRGSLSFNTDVFTRATAERLSAQFVHLLDVSSAAPTQTVEALIQALARIEDAAQARQAASLQEASHGMLARSRRRNAIINEGVVDHE